jgi:hypothetical protein
MQMDCLEFLFESAKNEQCPDCVSENSTCNSRELGSFEETFELNHIFQEESDCVQSEVFERDSNVSIISPVVVACTSGDNGASVVPNWLDSWSVEELKGFQDAY